MAMRWARQPNERGLARVVQSPRGWELRENGKVQMRVASLGNSNAWYWYGRGMNTSSTPVATPEEAKIQATEHYKSVRAAS